MLISQLPLHLKEKALSLQKQETKSEYKKDSDDLGWAFDWEYEKPEDSKLSSQGEKDIKKFDRWKFWKKCFDANHPNELPNNFSENI